MAAAFAPASADAAFVTAVDVAVRPAEGSPWSKGTLFQGEGFQVGATTSSGWAWGRAKGGAERCGWVLISEINSTTRTDTTCGAPSSEPLNDAEHVPGGGPSERWYVTCESATLFGNYGGPGQLSNAAGSVTMGAALGWRYTTGDNYAASVDGPTGTPRFLLRSCISRTPPAGPTPDPGPGPAPTPTPTPTPDDDSLGPPPFRVLDAEILFERFGDDDASDSARATAAAGSVSRRGDPSGITVKRTRATVRISWRNIVIATGLRDDVFRPTNSSCKGWYYGTMIRMTNGKPTGARYTGWVQGAGLSRTPRNTKGDCRRTFPFASRIGFVNAPFRSVSFRKRPATPKNKMPKPMWYTTGFPSKAFLKLDKQQNLDPDCTLSLNYVPGVGLLDPVEGDIANKVFKGGDVNRATFMIGYRYTTTDGNFALISVKSGFMARDKAKKGRPAKKRDVGVWAFVKRACVIPLHARASKTDGKVPEPRYIYEREIRICNRVKPSIAVKTLNRPPASERRLREKPCRLPNPGTQAKNPQPEGDVNGWITGPIFP